MVMQYVIYLLFDDLLMHVTCLVDPTLCCSTLQKKPSMIKKICVKMTMMSTTAKLTMIMNTITLGLLSLQL